MNSAATTSKTCHQLIENKTTKNNAHNKDLRKRNDNLNKSADIRSHSSRVAHVSSLRINVDFDMKQTLMSTYSLRKTAPR
jgi:hypothetical protein